MIYNSITVYNHLLDDNSRFLYEKRCMWSLTGDDKYIDDIIGRQFDREKADEMMKRAFAVQDKLMIRGVGNEFSTLMRYYPELNFKCIVDRDPVKVAMGTIDGHKVISVDEFYSDYSDHYIIVCSSAFHREIIKELKENGIPEEHIFDFGALAEFQGQYFEHGIVSPVEHEIFVDGGCYDGTTFRNFARWCGNSYDKIYSFEPDKHNYEMTLMSLKSNPLRRVTLINKGLWDKDEVLYFNETGGQGSSITDDSEGAASIDTTSIDNTVKGDPVTFIKLDVEGAEFEALKGAEATIRRFHPRMAISIYHKPDDIFTLPELILSMYDKYRFYLRHYQLSSCETILYAV